MSNLFQKNIEALSRKNTELAVKLQQYVFTEVPQVVQENGAYNLSYKNHFLHNRQNPLGEAREIFSMCENSPVSIHLIFGLGLGYLFQLTSLNSKGTVILYEPDLNILKMVFSLVDFSNDLLKDNVFIYDNLNNVAEAIYKKSGMQNSPQLLSLPSQRKIYNETFEDLVKKLQELVGAYNLDLKYTKEKFYKSTRMILRNFPKLINEIPLVKLKDRFKGKTAVIVSAGPTLDKNIETIKKYRKNFVLFVVGTALKTIVKNNITPDFVLIIETHNSSKQLEGIDTKNFNFISEPYSHPKLREFEYKNVFTHISANNPINELYKEITDEDISEYSSKGTVSYTALNSARILGCSKIILVGQDLAYLEGQCYSKDSAYKDLICTKNLETGKWEIQAKDFDAFVASLSNSENEETRIKVAKRRLENLNKALYYVKGIQGDMLPTESVYSSFIKPLSEYTQIFNDREYINTSLVGAQIDGFKNVSLEEALKDTEPVGDLDLATNFAFNKDKIKEKFYSEFDKLKSVQPTIAEGKRLIQSIRNDLKRSRAVNANILKTLKKISLNYISISSDFTNTSKLFDFAITSNRIDLDYEFKMTTNFDFSNVSSIIEKLGLFYDTAEEKITSLFKLKDIIKEEF